jgi:hypothetical protein
MSPAHGHRKSSLRAAWAAQRPRCIATMSPPRCLHAYSMPAHVHARVPAYLSAPADQRTRAAQCISTQAVHHQSYISSRTQAGHHQSYISSRTQAVHHQLYAAAEHMQYTSRGTHAAHQQCACRVALLTSCCALQTSPLGSSGDSRASGAERSGGSVGAP